MFYLSNRHQERCRTIGHPLISITTICIPVQYRIVALDSIIVKGSLRDFVKMVA